MRRDPLAAHWRHPIVVERHRGTSGGGRDLFDPAGAPVKGAIDDRQKLIRGPDGSDVVSEARVLFPIETPAVPLGSRLTLPPDYGSRTGTVVAVSRHDGGGLPTPDHWELALS